MFKKPESIKITSFLIGCFAATLGLQTSLISQAAPAPSTIGQCSETHISTVGARLIDAMTGEPIPDSGVSVHLNNGVILIASTKIPAVESLKRGDQVKLCLESVPKNCRTGDYRGMMYRIINYRTGKEFTLSNSTQSCNKT